MAQKIRPKGLLQSKVVAFECTYTAECRENDKVRDTAAASEGWQCQDDLKNRFPYIDLLMQLSNFWINYNKSGKIYL